ncbi:MAG: PhoU domain-containing protein [Candidatus Methylomirabilales bacterium]
MWFKELYEIWRGDSSLSRALKDSYTMLEETGSMFAESVRSLRESDTGELRFNIYEKDQMINRYQQEVRRNVLKYLGVTGGLNVIPGLILTSIVVDMERIGDYTKNIADLAVAHRKRLAGGRFEDDFEKVERTVKRTFAEIIPILKDSKRETARQLIDDTYWVIKKCDEIVDKLIKEDMEEFGPKESVSVGLYARYLKRIQSHLLNIASSVVNPFERIGFKREDDE